MTVLGVDTSNYATSLALVDVVSQEVVCAKKKMLPVRPGQLGLRQSDAVFGHIQALPLLLKELAQEARLQDRQVKAVGVSVRPRPVEGSYMPCFLAGKSFAAAYATALNLPLIETSHQEGHLAAARYAAQSQGFQAPSCLTLHMSGGTTELVLAKGHSVQGLVGKSLDLYAGQAVDRLAARLGFSFPGGAKLSALAAMDDSDIRPKATVRGCDCHLSGLENQCEALLGKGAQPAYVARYCLSYVAQTAVEMLQNALRGHPGLPVLCMGGVMSSDLIRTYVQQRVPNVFFVPALYSSDNAIGAALIAA